MRNWCWLAGLVVNVAPWRFFLRQRIVSVDGTSDFSVMKDNKCLLKKYRRGCVNVNGRNSLSEIKIDVRTFFK